ncbi:gliding motility-associated-like protein [Pedobacter sp. UYEF25]
MQYVLRIGLFLVVLIFTKQVVAQQICSGSLGDPIAGAGTDFGRGQSNFGPPSSTNTTYRYVEGTPDDGEYTLTKSTNGLNSGWLQNIKNHTPNDLDGYMMVVNASFTKDIFYSSVVRDLCPGTTYEFGAYIINILRGTGIKPNVHFAAYDSSHNLLASYTTGDIPEGGPNDWKKYALIFKTIGGGGAVTIELSNENPGGGGNDLALDDITFRACGPQVITMVDDEIKPSADACYGINKSVKLKASVSPGYTDPAYQWQVDNGLGYTDIPRETNLILNLDTRSFSIGTYNYRVRVAERINIGSTKCSVFGYPVSVIVHPIPTAIAAVTNRVCVGESLHLAATGGTAYSWTGPEGFTSTEQNPIILDAQENMSGNYSVIVSANGCSSIAASTEAKVVKATVAKTNAPSVTICKTASAQLQAIYDKNYSYSWYPTDGLSNANVANPTASPTKNTTYTVTVTNGVCSASDTTRVLLVENPIITAGADIKLFSGQSKHLGGKITGADYDFYWTPTDFLDDPKSLNPLASPPKDIKYTLHVISNFGCFDLISNIFVTVYPEIIIPTAFSPNGDGINDTWMIAAAGAFEHAKIKIFNRYGNLVYQNDGVFTSWDGKYKGMILPTGVYYYTAYFNEDFKTFSGSITLLR